MRDRRDMDNPRIPRIPGFLVIPALTVCASCIECILPYYGPYLLRGNGDHTPIQDLESYESILREVLTLTWRAASTAPGAPHDLRSDLVPTANRTHM